MDRRREMTYHGSYVTEICIVVGGQVRLLGKLWRSAFIPEGYSQEPGFDLNLEFKHLTEEEIQDCPEFTHEYARICSFSIPPRPIRCLWMSGERKRFPLHLKFKVVRKYGRRIFFKKNHPTHPPRSQIFLLDTPYNLCLLILRRTGIP